MVSPRVSRVACRATFCHTGGTMLTRIDHVVICVADLARGIETYTRLGFNVYPGGAHPGRGTHNAIALNADDYLELRAVRDPGEYRRSEERRVGKARTC